MIPRIKQSTIDGLQDFADQVYANGGTKQITSHELDNLVSRIKDSARQNIIKIEQTTTQGERQP